MLLHLNSTGDQFVQFLFRTGLTMVRKTFEFCLFDTDTVMQEGVPSGQSGASVHSCVVSQGNEYCGLFAPQGSVLVIKSV